MTGWTRAGKSAHQREKVYAMIRNNPKGGLTVYDITGNCWGSHDEALVSIKSTTVRRCLQELKAQEIQIR